MPLYVTRPYLPQRQEIDKYLDDIYERDWLTNSGPLVAELEKRLGEYLDEHMSAKHVVAVASGTAGLQIAAVACGLRAEDEIIMPAWTYPATPMAFSWLGMKPAFCDVDTLTHNLDPQKVEEYLENHDVEAILAVHLWGRLCNIDKLSKIAAIHDIPLIYDAAHAFGFKYWPAGCWRDCAVFSFHATKIFNTVEGGAIIARNKPLAEKCRQLRDCGKDNEGNFVEIGTNASMSELHAAFGLAGLDQLEKRIEQNIISYDVYRYHLADIDEIRLIDYPQSCTRHYIVITAQRRDELAEYLRTRGMMAKTYFSPACHRLPMYAEDAPELPVTERLAETTLALPSGAGLTPVDIKIVSDLIREFYA